MECITRICARCGAEKPLSEFTFKDRARGIRHSWCRACFAEYKRDWYLRHREGHIEHVRVNRTRSTAANQIRIWQHLAQHPCVDCGETDIVVLEFDHIRDKHSDVSHMATMGFCWETIEAEIAKCEIRCANCHRRKTARERGFYDRKRNSVSEEAGPWCGSISAILVRRAVSSADRAPTF